MSGRIGVSGACAAALALASPAFAQQGLQPCSVTFQETLRAGDITATQGEVKFGPIMPQAGGGFVAQGMGEAAITYTAGRGGCTVVSGSPHTAKFQAFMTSEDGRTAELDLVPVEFSYTVKFRCAGSPGLAEYDAAVPAPETVKLQLRDGATTPWSYSDGRTTTTGSATLHYCAPFERRTPP